MISTVRIGLLCAFAAFAAAGAQAATTLNLGTTYAGTISVPGQTNAFTFNGSSGQRLFFDSLDASGLNLYASLYSPGGVLLYQRNDDYDGNPWVLTEPGLYTLVIAAYPNSSVTGNYSFRVLDFSAAPTLSLGTTFADQLSPPLACNAYQFSGKRGQQFSFQWVSYSTNQFLWQFLSPANAVLAQGQYYQAPSTITLPMDGSYVLLVQGTGAGTTPLTFQLQASLVTDTTVTATGFGTVHSGTVWANTTNSFTYTATAGLPVFFDSLDASGQSLVVDLMDPTGNAVFSVGEVTDSGPYVLPRSGTYTLNVRAPGGGSGNFNFRLLDLTASPTLTLNTTTSNSLALAYQCDVYQFTASAGQRLYYDSQLSSSPNVQIQLVQPTGQALFGATVYYDQGPLTLPVSGTYYFLVQNNSSGGTSYVFDMLDIAAQPALPLNTDLTGTLAANTALIYQLAGSAGQKLYFNSKGGGGSGSYWTLYDSRNSGVSGASLSGDFEVTLPYNANYVLVFAGVPSAVTYSNQVNTFAFTTNALVLGTSVTNNIFNPGDQVFYTFTGTAGQRIYYDGTGSGYVPNLNISLYTPTGISLSTSGNVGYDFGPLRLPQSGTYTLVFDGGGHSTGGISFTLLDVAAQPVVPINTDLTGTIATNASLVYRLQATQGQKLYFNAKAGNIGGAYWSLYDPYNNSVFAGAANIGSDFEPPPMAYSGDYVLVLSAASSPAPYSNQINSFTYTTNAINIGTVVTNNLVNPGDQIYYTFSGTAGQRIYYDALLPSAPQIYFSLYSPSGQSLVGNNYAGYDYSSSLIQLPQTGTYLMVIDGSGETVGPVSFQLLDLDAQPTLPLNTDLVGSLAPNLSIAYKLSGSAGQHLYFNAKVSNGGAAYWTLYGPNGAQVGYNNLGGDFEETLPFSGNYALVLSASTSAISYSNQVNTFTYVTNALSLGTDVTSSVVNPGDQLIYTFSGTAGQRLYFDARETNYVPVNLTLYSPSGATPFYGSTFGDSQGPFTLTQNGTYTLVVDAPGDLTGLISFNLLDLSGATPVTLGTTITDALVDQTQTRLYKFSGTAGQRVNLQSLSASGSQAYWVLYGPTDAAVSPEPTITGNIGIVTLPITGTYTLAVIGGQYGPAPVTYQLSLTDVSDSSVASSGFGAVHSGTVNANSTNTYTYTGSAGTPVFFDSQDTSGQNLVADLFAPDGTLVFSVVETSDAGPYVLPRSGTYTLNVRGYNGASGNYSFRLLDLGASPQLSLNTAISGTLNNPYETDVYKFTSTPGQSLIYDALTNDVNYPSVFANILDPKGQSIGPSGANFQTDRGPFLVQYGGTCYFFLRNNQSTGNIYSFQLLDVATQPVLPVNTSVTNIQGVFAQTVYRYSGTAGQQLYFQGQPNNPGGYWTMFDPNDLTVSGGYASLANDFEVTLPSTGIYTVTFSSYSSAPGQEVFLINDFNYLTNAYTIGTKIVDAIRRPGERHFYTFTGTLGQTLYYDALTNDPAGPGRIYATLYNPQGNQEGPIAGSAFSYDRGPFTLQQSGTYTLVFDGSGSEAGTYAFQLLDVSVQPVLPLNQSVTNNMDPFPTLVYRYAGTAGQRLYFYGDRNNVSGYWALFDPNNTQVNYASLANDFEVSLPTTGQYSLILYNYTSSSGPGIFQVNDFLYYTNAYTIGTAITDAIKRPGERRYYAFTGTVGQRLIYNALTNDPPSPNTITARLIDPAGIDEGQIGGRFSANRGPFTLQSSGTYTLELDGSTASVGPFAFQILDVAAQPTLPLTGPVTNTLGVFPLQVYQYAGLPGQHLYFRAMGNNPSGNWFWYDPNNSAVVVSGLAGDFEVTLQTAGTYVLSLINYSAAPAIETFQVNPFNANENLSINRAPILGVIPAQVWPADALVTFTAQATDPDNNTLTFSLDAGAPGGATINPTTGVFSWNPPVTGLSSVTPVTIRVTDNGSPNLSAAQTLSIEVIAGPMMISAIPSNNVVNVSWHSAPGKHYQLFYKDEIYDPTWQALGSAVTATALVTVQLDASIGNRTHRFYRIEALDPLTP